MAFIEGLTRQAEDVLRSAKQALVTSVADLQPSRADFTVTKAQREHLGGPIIYATYTDDGRCRYVGKSWRGVIRPFGHHHRLDTDREWTVLRIWKVTVSSDEDLAALEQAAIAAFRPELNINDSSSVRGRRTTHLERSLRSSSRLQPLLTTRDVADLLGVTPRFVVGEIRDGRLQAISLSRPGKRVMYRIEMRHFRTYLAQIWRPRLDGSTGRAE